MHPGNNKLVGLLRNLTTIFFLLIISKVSYSQVKIGNNPGVIDPVSILEMETDSLVMVLPRMTSTDRSAISNPYPGAVIYNTSLSCVEVNVGSKATPDWQCLADSTTISSTGHNLTFDINSAEDSIRIIDDGGILGILISEIVSALNTQGGIIADSTLDVNWNDISGMPSDMQNNDQYITSASSFDEPNEELDVVISNGGTDFSIDLSDLATDADVTTEIGDTAYVLRNLISASNAADLDTDPSNEENTDFSISGSGIDDSLSITDSGGTKSVDLGNLVNAMSDDGLATDLELAASDAADLDKDATNEYNSSVGLSGTNLQVIDGGGTKQVDLDGTFATDAELVDTATAIRLYIDTQVTATSGADMDKVTGNEYNTDFSVVGTGTSDSLAVTDPGGVEGVDLGELVTAMDDDGLATDTDVTTEIGDTSAVLRNLINANNAADLDTDPTNEYNSGFTISGSGTTDSLSVTDSGGTESVDLGDLVSAMDDDGLATDTDVSSEIGDTASVLRVYADDNDDYLGKNDQTLSAGREIITDGYDLRITGTGRVGIGDIAIPGNSKLFVDGLISSSSDRRLKTDISILNYGLKELLSVNAVAYTWKDPNKAKMEGRQLGFIAQDVRGIMPELVRGVESEENFLSLTYDRFAPVLVNAIKELDAELKLVRAELKNALANNDKLKEENTRKESDFNQLRAELDQIKQALGMIKGSNADISQD